MGAKQSDAVGVTKILTNTAQWRQGHILRRNVVHPETDDRPSLCFGAYAPTSHPARQTNRCYKNETTGEIWLNRRRACTLGGQITRLPCRRKALPCRMFAIGRSRRSSPKRQLEDDRSPIVDVPTTPSYRCIRKPGGCSRLRRAEPSHMLRHSSFLFPRRWSTASKTSN